MVIMNRFLLLTSILISLFLLASCDQDLYDPPAPQQRTNLRVFNAYAPSPIDVRLNTFGDEVRYLAQRLPFGKAWPEGGYASMLTRTADSTGKDSISVDVISYGVDTLLIDEYPDNLAANAFASYYIVDSAGQAVLIKPSDDFEFTAPDQAVVRFINLYPNLNSVEFESSKDELGFVSFAFLNFSVFTNVPEGSRSFTVYNAATGSAFATLEDVNLERGGAYTFYLLSQNGNPVFDYERVY